jgi:hypothetical protein
MGLPANGGRRALTLIKAAVSLLVWVPFSYVAIYVCLIVSLHGGNLSNAGRAERSLLGNITLIGSSLVYAATGYGLVLWVRGKSGTGGASVLTSGATVNRRPDADLQNRDDA